MKKIYPSKLIQQFNRAEDKVQTFEQKGKFSIAIDLTPLLPEGANGGHKRYVMHVIPWLRKRFHGRCRFLFFTSSISHSEIREKLMAQGDRIICINKNRRVDMLSFHGRGDRDFFWHSPPLDMLWRLDAHLLYAPFGSTSLHCPGIPTIVHVIDLLHVDYPEGINGEEVHRRHQYFETMVNQADIFQCSSDYSSNRFANIYQVALEKIVRTYLPLPISSPRDTAPHTKLKKYFYYPANFWPHKNHATLLAAYAHYVLKQKEKAWDLVLTGFDSSKAREFLCCVNSLGLRERVRYEGYVNEDKLHQIWCSASALVFPSLYEGFGIPLIEAMAHGLPIICGKDASLEEVGGEAAFYVKSKDPLSIADALVKVSSNEELYNQLSSKVQARFRDFSFDLEMEKLAVTIEKLFTRRSARPTTVGFTKDGQVLRNAAFNSSQKGLLLLRGKWKSDNSTGRLRMRCGMRQAGSWLLKKGESTTILATIYSDGAPIIFEFTEEMSLLTQAEKEEVLHCESLTIQGEDGIEKIYKC